MKKGSVYLIGAGPGAADLITLRGLRCLQQADVILHDRLIDLELLAMAQPEALLLEVGKSRGHAARSQAEINRLMIEYARAGKVVARLKGGDPFVLGRGGEEVKALADAGIPCEVVPGVSAAIAAAALAGIPVTHRELSQGFAVFTGHDPPEQLHHDWAALARIGTLVLLMGVEHLPAISAALINAGRDPATPAAAVQAASLPDQRVVVSTLGGLAAAVQAAGLRPPTTVVIGAVVGLQETLRWATAAAAPGAGGALTDGALTDGALTGGTLTGGALTDGALTGGALTGGRSS